MSLQGKNIIITGATSGLGVKIASVLSNEGASVFIGGRRADRGQKVAEETNTSFHKVDVVDQDSNKNFFAAAEKFFGGPQSVDFILLNAGVEGDSSATMIQSMDIEAYDYIYNVNVRGVMLGMQFGTPLLRKGGTFVFTSSVASVMQFSGNPVYASSKAAVDSLARSYAAQFAEAADERIKSLSVMTMNPTLFNTDLADRFTGKNKDALEGFAKMLNPCQRLGSAKELSTVIRNLVQGDLPYKSGEHFVIDGDTHFPLNEYFSRLQEATA